MSESSLLKIFSDCKKGIEAILDKFRRDKLLVFALLHEDFDLVPSNNRKTESSFSTLKHTERLFIGM
jgi:hypothetical protein